MASQLPQVPYNTPMTDKSGIMTNVWASFFRGILSSFGGTSISYPISVANGGTGSTTQQAALNALSGSQASGKYLRGNGTNVTLSSIVAADVPTLNQNTTGTANNITATTNSTLTTLPSLSLPGTQVSGNIGGNSANVTGTVAIANGGTGQITQQAAMDALAGAQSSGKYLRSDGTHTTLQTIQAADVPTLNQNTTGTASNVTGTVAVANGGTGQTTANAGLNALLPSQTGNSGKVLKSDGSNASWGSASGSTAPSLQKFTATGTTAGYLFTISTSTTCAVGDTYTNNGNTYTVLGALSAQSGQVLFMSGASAPLSSGTLTRSSGAGTASITFTANVPLATYTTPSAPSPLYLKVTMVGAGGGGGGGGGSGATSGGSGTGSFFGANILIANGGTGGIAEQVGTGNGGTGGSASLGSALGLAVGGGAGTAAPSPSANSSGGAGGSSLIGGNGGGTAAGGGAGVAASANSGSGGGGGPGGTSVSGGGGGGAGGGVNALITSPAATYYYAVGTKGTGGTAGTSGAAGGNGADGVIVVEEHYQ